MKHHLYLTILVIALFITGCTNGWNETKAVPYPVPGPVMTTPGPVETITVTTPGPTVYLPAPVASLSEDILNLVSAENDYREGLGQTLLANGLSCTLYTTTGGDRIQGSIAGHNTLTGLSQVASFTYKGIFNQPDSNVNTFLNVLPAPIQPLYLNNYMLRCQGQLVVTTTGYYTFDLTSDDGSLLYVDGGKLIDNDNNHGSTLVSAQKYLRRGVHAFRLDYAQTGAGNMSLILTANGSFIDPMYLFH